jgi:hypothetical protein
VVTSKERTAEGNLILAQLSLVNQDGEEKLSGSTKVLAT